MLHCLLPMSEDRLIWLIPVIFIPAFVALWSGVCFLIGLLGGWRSLSARYAGNATSFQGRTWTMCSGFMRLGARYNGVLKIGADTRGLYLAVLALFRPGHAPLYIPWEDIEIRERSGFLMPYMDFLFTRTDLRITVPRSLGEEVAREGNRPVGRQAT